jgi:ABC-2 type transport system ATP-binding protein
MIETDNLTKHYGRQTAVSGVSIRCEPGTVTGFLGPNGAGKSTTLRMITGLTPPSAGSSRVLGVPYEQLPNPGNRVGVLLDASAMHAGRTGRETLAVSAQIIGVDPRRVGDLLSQVGLERSAARKRVRQYSLGMRQRLGIAQALLGDPEVLILDEPANGLDPEGIRWMRDLLRGFADRGGTVLLSSHLLHEVEALADRLLIISNGRIVASGAIDELLAGGGTLVRAREEARLGDVLERAGLEARRAGGGGFVVDAEPEQIGGIALREGVALRELRVADRGGLEDLFINLTRGPGENGASSSTPTTNEHDLMEVTR